MNPDAVAIQIPNNAKRTTRFDFEPLVTGNLGGRASISTDPWQNLGTPRHRNAILAANRAPGAGRSPMMNHALPNSALPTIPRITEHRAR